MLHEHVMEHGAAGVTYRVDAAELLGGIVRAYFEERGNDRPLAEDGEAAELE
jgi:hypothetical protein